MTVYLFQDTPADGYPFHPTFWLNGSKMSSVLGPTRWDGMKPIGDARQAFLDAHRMLAIEARKHGNLVYFDQEVVKDPDVMLACVKIFANESPALRRGMYGPSMSFIR